MKRNECNLRQKSIITTKMRGTKIKTSLVLVNDYPLSLLFFLGKQF